MLKGYKIIQMLEDNEIEVNTAINIYSIDGQTLLMRALVSADDDKYYYLKSLEGYEVPNSMFTSNFVFDILD